MSLSDGVMALGDPMVALTLASLPDGTMNLAAFGVAKGFAVFFESPIIMVLHASNVLSKDKPSSDALWRMSVLAGAVLSLGLLLTGLGFEALHSLGLSSGLSSHARESAAFLACTLSPWPILIALRRHGQGLLISAGKTDTVAHGALLRLAVLTATLALTRTFVPKGYVVAGVAMLSGLIAEWGFITYKARPHTTPRAAEEDTRWLHTRTLRGVSAYYLPLAWTMVSLWGCRLGITLVLASAGETVIAVWAAGWALATSLANGVRMLQQLVIRHHGPQHTALLRNFVWGTGFAFTAVFVFLGFSPTGLQMLTAYTSGDGELARAVQDMLRWLCLLPVVMAWQNALQGRLMAAGQTRKIGLASVVGSALLFGLVLGAQQLDMATATLTALLVVLTGALEVVGLAAVGRTLRTSALSRTRPDRGARS